MFSHMMPNLGGVFFSISTSTSRKHGKKEPQLFSHCGSFDHPYMRSLNDCNFEIMGACNIPLERYFQDLSSGILKSPEFLKFQLVMCM